LINLDFILKWVACFVTLAGALFTSFDIAHNKELLLAGSVLYLIWSVRIRELNLIVINAALALIYIVPFVWRYCAETRFAVGSF
jgi:hypothetical protein